MILRRALGLLFCCATLTLAVGCSSEDSTPASPMKPEDQAAYQAYQNTGRYGPPGSGGPSGGGPGGGGSHGGGPGGPRGGGGHGGR